MPKISCILAAYNATRFIRAAVDSVLAQTFGDFELICVNDGSKDDTPKILDDYAARDARVKVIHQTNAGQVHAAINGIAVAQAPLIARMDADDICSPDRFAKQVGFMDAHPDVVVLGGAYELVDEHARLLTTITQPQDDAALQDICLVGRCPICQPLAIFRRDAYDRAGGYRPDFSPAEDLDMWLRMGEVGKIACLPDVLLKYRQHGGSISERKQDQQIETQREACRQAWERRGVVGKYEFARGANWRATGDADSMLKQSLKYGWWAWNSGEYATARSYGWESIRRRPTDPRGWKLLATSVLKRIPRAQ